MRRSGKPRLRFYRDFPQLQGECRGIILCKDGARPAFPCRHSGLTKVPVHSRAIRSCDYATLGSNPRKPFNQSMPSHIFVVNKVKPPVFPSVVSVMHNPSFSIVSRLLSPEIPSHAGMAKQTRGRRKSPPLVRPLVGRSGNSFNAWHCCVASWLAGFACGITLQVEHFLVRLQGKLEVPRMRGLTSTKYNHMITPLVSSARHKTTF
jgi:hypothetical protein